MVCEEGIDQEEEVMASGLDVGAGVDFGGNAVREDAMNAPVRGSIGVTSGVLTP